MRQLLAAALLIIVASTPAVAGGGSGAGTMSWRENQAAAASASDVATILSWFLSLTGVFNPVGSAETSLSVANTLVDDAISFQRSMGDFQEAMDLALAAIGPVKSEEDMDLVKAAVRQELRVSPLSPGVRSLYGAIEAEVAARGLKKY